ncbi:hypothetical protein D9613_009271 [Agrocybe pediades]|uniref:BD-FAE-like domain-containing protein n=1 Tax=Agrocybe pediades TaxID=84607 RepID=A0A8H4R5E1_9AGAR|nr:hypothetical protein D9613_009271 [Agrocybe pediades]
MDVIAQVQDREIPAAIGAAIAAFTPLLKAKEAFIKEIPSKSFKYGPSDRHNLDIYYPKVPPASSESAPVLFFCYGGGLSTGDRRLAMLDLVYSNLGAYFARHGYVVVIPDYRLVPNVTFPGGSEDVRDAVRWVCDDANGVNLVLDGSPKPDLNKIFIMGHSAGALHITTMIFNESVLPFDDELRQRIVGIIPHGCPYELSNMGGSAGPGAQYYGNIEAAIANSPLSLFRRLPQAGLDKLPHILMVEGENEPDWLKDAGNAFHGAVKERTGKSVPRIFGKGHSHISSTWALCTGQGEGWAEEIVAWIQQVC